MSTDIGCQQSVTQKWFGKKMTKKYAVALLVFASLHPGEESLFLQGDTSQAPLDEQEVPAFDANLFDEVAEERDVEYAYAP